MYQVNVQSVSSKNLKWIEDDTNFKGQSTSEKREHLVQETLLSTSLIKNDNQSDVKLEESARHQIMSRTAISDTTADYLIKESVPFEDSPNLIVSALSETALVTNTAEVIQPHAVELISKLPAADTNTGVDTIQVSLPVNMVLNQKDTCVMYLNPNGTLVFDPSGLSSCASENIPLILEPNTNSVTGVSTSDMTPMNSNYLVVVENIDGSQMLSTTMHGNLVLSSGGDIPVSGIAPQTQVSFTSAGNEEEDSKLNKSLTDYSQQTITMVLDGSSHLRSKGVVDPNSFMTYDQTLNTDQLTIHTADSENDKAESTTATAQHMFESTENAFIDISSFNVVTSDTPSSTTVHHKPISQTLTFNARGTQTAFIRRESNSQIHDKQLIQKNVQAGIQETASIRVDQTDSILGSKEQLADDASTHEEQGELEEFRLARQKEEQRILEQCHLEHHMQQIKKRQVQYFEPGLKSGKSKQKEAEDLMEVQEDDVLSYEDMGINDETPIFSAITAKLNSAILAHVPGCQQFLLETAKDISFASETDCTFNGSLKSLINLHNLLKCKINLSSRTLVQFKIEREKEKSKKYPVDRIMYSFLKPYVSLRGRQPKCSLKAAEMGFLSDVDAYINFEHGSDNGDVEYEKSSSQQKSNILKGKKKRGRPARCLRGRGHKVRINSFSAVANSKISDEVVLDSNTLKNDIVEDVEKNNINEESVKESVVKKTSGNSTDGNETDPLYQRLRKEQIKYREIMYRKKSHIIQESALLDRESSPIMDEVPDQDDSISEQTVGINADISEIAQENSATVEVPNTGKQKRGRPRKIYDLGAHKEKVHPRNPLTESAATKQQRNYEEQVSFKFFCSFCSYKTKRQSHFLSHMQCHRDGTEKKYNCKQCDFITISLPMLRRHELKHKKNLFWCDICAAYSTDREALLRRHIRMKHGLDMGKLSCDQCSFTCDNTSVLVRHKTVHEGLAQVPDDGINSCPDCKKSFRLRMHLKRHMRDVHGPELRPYLCDKCGKAFKRTDALQQHKLVHVSRTARSFPFKCSQCEKGFRSPAHLKEHMSMHSSERPFLCQYCGAAFKTPAVQKKHIMTLHIRPRTHVCTICCRQFNTKHALQRHENTHAKPDDSTEAAVSIIERENGLDEKGTLHGKDETLITTVVGQSIGLTAGESATILVDGPISSCLPQDMIGSAAAAAIEEPLEQTGQGIQQAYIQGAQDGTLYYFTGELPTL